jgi:hypothetical protein
MSEQRSGRQTIADISELKVKPSGSSALVKVADHTSGWVNVRSYGAKGDGTTDDTAAIQAAIDAANARGGGRVLIPEGTFIAAPATSGADRIFTLYDNTTIEGVGPGSVLKIKDNAGDYGRIFGAASTITSATFRNFKIDQNPSGNLSQDISATVETRKASAIKLTVNRLLVEGMRFDPTVGVTTISVNGDTAGAIVKGNYFRFVKGASTAAAGYYDNSAVYLETSQQVVEGNIFETTLADDAFGCIETHGGRSSVIGNSARNFETLVNIVSRIGSFPDFDPNNVSIVGNSVTGAKKAIEIWSMTGRSVKNVTIANNTIDINNVDRAADDLHGNSWFAGIGIIYSSGGALNGGVEGLTITGNSITHQIDAATDYGSDESLSGGISLQSNGLLANVTITGNAVVNAPKFGIVVWPRAQAADRVLVSGNLVVDAGANAVGNAAYRSAVGLFGVVRHTDVIGNRIVDTGSAALVGSRALSLGLSSPIKVRFARNQTTSYSASALTFSASPDPAEVLVATSDAMFASGLGFAIDNTYDVGGASTRPRDVYVGRDLAVGRDVAVSGILKAEPTSGLALQVTPPASNVSALNVRHSDLTDGVVVDGIGRLLPKYAVAFTRIAPTYGPSVTPNAKLGNEFAITATNGTAFTVESPSNVLTGQRITIRVRNTSGGALGAITWGAAYKMAAWTSPAAGFSRAIDFQYDGTNWIEASRTPADVPN